MEKDKKNEIPAWLQKDYVPVSVDIERAYEQDLIKYGRALPEGFIDTKVLAKYDEILINFEEYEFLGILLGPIIVSKGGKWGLTRLDGEEILPCKYEKVLPRTHYDFGVKQNGKWGVFHPSGEKWDLHCSHDMIYCNRPSPIGLVVYSDKGKFGWTGCQFSENNIKAEYDIVYLPCKEYFYSDQYGDEIESFVAIKDGKIDFYEYWTSK